MTKILVGGGSTSAGVTNEVEIIDLETSSTICQNVEDFPTAFYGAIGGLAVEDKPLVCGGNPLTNECHYLENGNWLPFSFMNNAKQYAAVSQSPFVDGVSTLFVTGGSNGTGSVNATSLSEVLNERKWENSLPLPVPLLFHCMVLLNSTTIVVIGGSNKDNQSQNTYLLNSEHETWAEGPMLNKARHAMSCGRIRKSSQSHQYSIIAAGGWDGNYMSTVEIYDEETGKWRFGPELPISLCCGALIEDPVGGIVLVGGENRDDLYHDSVYRLSHAGPDAEWVKMPQKLKTGRNRHVAFLVSDDVTTCSL
jgi:hypothetical protein